jgi:hypothetical protein
MVGNHKENTPLARNKRRLAENIKIAARGPSFSDTPCRPGDNTAPAGDDYTKHGAGRANTIRTEQSRLM